jgi:hypothetical protein
MNMWSQGLGRMELVVDFCHYKVVSESDKTIIKGVTNEPVQWDFTITFEKDDIPGLLNIFLKPRTMLFVLLNMRHVFQFVFEKIFQRERYAEVTTK